MASPRTSSSYWLLLLSCCLALSSPSCQRGVMDPSDNKRLVIVHDGSLRPQLELWMVTALLEDAARIVCSTSSIRVETFRMPTEDFMIRGTVHLSGASWSEYGGLVVTSRDCRTTDRMMSLLVETLSSIKMIAPPSILRLDFIQHCPPRLLQETDSSAQQDRLDFSNEEEGGRCTRYALDGWIQFNICPPPSYRQLGSSMFRIDKAFEECATSRCIFDIPDVIDDSSDANGIQRRRQPSSALIRLTWLERPPFVIFERQPDGTVTGYKGYCYEIIHTLQESLDFTYEVEFPEDETYGKELINGSWNGMIGMLMDNRVDIGAGPFSVTYSRAKVVDFTVSFYEEPTTILVPPPTEDTALLACTRPFQLQVWLCLVLLATVLPLILWKHLKYLWRHYDEPTTTTAQQGRTSDINSLGLAHQYFFVLSVLVAQPGQRSVPSLGVSPRLLAAVWSLSAVVLVSAYGGVLTSLLSLRELRPIINTLDDLPRSQMAWGVRRGTALESLFTEATGGVYKIIGESLVKKPHWNVDKDQEGIERTASGNYAYIKEKSYLEFQMGEDRQCRLSLAKQEFFKVNFAFALAKGSPLKPLMDRKILQMMEAGLGERWKRMYWPSSSIRKCRDAEQPRRIEHSSLSLKSLQGAFLVWAVGIALAWIAFIVEGCSSFCVTLFTKFGS